MCRPSQFESVPSTKIALRNYTEPYRCYAMTEAQLLTPTSMLGRSCANATLCNNDQFTAVPLAAMTDRVCDTTTTCTLQQFEFQVATATSNRICSNVTDCAVDTFIAVPTTANSNNVCMKLFVCTSKEFEHTSPTAASNRTFPCIRPPYNNGTAYLVTTASPNSDRVCIYRSSPCTAYTVTVCRPASDCARRCKYDKSASYCFSVADVAPCNLYSNRSVCSYDHGLWSTPLNECQPRPAIAQTSLASAFEALTCTSLTQATCTGVSLCRWNILTALCLAIACSDIYDSTVCTEQGCTYTSTINKCSSIGTLVPCINFYTPALCDPTSHCSFNSDLFTCVPRGISPSCSLFSALDALGRPSHDIYSLASLLCHDPDINVVCNRFNTASTCPVTNRFEYQSHEATSLADTRCAPLTSCSGGQLMTANNTAISDRSGIEMLHL